MKNKLVREIKSVLGKGLITIIYGPRGSGKTTFLFRDIKNILKENRKYIYIEFKNVYFAEAMNKIKSLQKDKNKYILLIDDIFSFEKSESLINLIFSSKNIEAFATSDISINFALGKKLTQVRGRIYSIFYPNYLFEEYKYENKNKSIFDYYNEIIKRNKFSVFQKEALFNYICSNFGNVLTFNSLIKKKQVNESVVTIIRKFSKYLGYNMFYFLSRVDLTKMRDIATGFVVYPTNYNLIYDKTFNNESIKLFFTTSIVEKLFYDNWKVYVGTYRFQKMFNNKRKYFIKNICLLAKKNNHSVLIALNLNNENDLNLELFNDVRLSLPKIIIELGSSDIKYDYNGVMHVGIEMFLCKGVKF